jgi:hypothetical protein
MSDESADVRSETDEYYTLSEDAVALLPPGWRDQIQARLDDGRAVLKSVDDELSQLSRLSNSLTTLMTLKHVQRRLSEYRFEPTLDAFLDLDILTTAFVVTYVRLKESGNGTGFSRSKLPRHLRGFHDQIIDLRNKRFAHQGGHHTIENAMEIDIHDDRFEVVLGMSLGFHIGGATEWHELIAFLDTLYAERSFKLLARLKEKTGHKWRFPTGPAPTNSV